MPTCERKYPDEEGGHAMGICLWITEKNSDTNLGCKLESDEEATKIIC